MDELVIPVVLASDNKMAARELYSLNLALRNELLNQPIVSVTSAPDTIPEQGAKGLGVSETQLLVTLSSQVLPAMILLFSNWLIRQKDQHLHIKVGDAEVDIPIGVSSEQVEQIVKALLKVAKQLH